MIGRKSDITELQTSCIVVKQCVQIAQVFFVCHLFVFVEIHVENFFDLTVQLVPHTSPLC